MGGSVTPYLGVSLGRSGKGKSWVCNKICIGASANISSNTRHSHPSQSKNNSEDCCFAPSFHT
eukprot:scaffold6655_cov169-Amphora_coffeaeformis.AAC.7